MKDKDIGTITAWLMQGGLEGMAESDLLAGFCQLCRSSGLAIERGVSLMDTLHPIYEGRIFRWDNRGALEPVFEYGSVGRELSVDNWRRSAFYFLQKTDQTEVRRRIGIGAATDFFSLEMLKEAGHTDFIAFAHRFGDAGSFGDMDCFYSYFTTTAKAGFSESELQALRTLLPCLALASKSTALARITRTIAEVYLGEDAAWQVLHGKIMRGKAERISAVLWYSDLASFTRISDTTDPDDIIPMLNDYSDAVISSIHQNNGNVLKLIGDGILAIFKAPLAADACAAALQAEAVLRIRMRNLNAQREIEGRPVTDVYLGLHIGDVFYGNIGSQDRLDFTVIGPAVNEVSRISQMCHAVERNMLLSTEFVRALPILQRNNIFSVGRYALRGVQRPQELFTVVPPE